MSNILISLNFVISLLYLCCISCYKAQNAAISSALAPFELEAFQFSNENDSSNKYYLIWERPVYFLPSNYISHANIDKDANDLLLHQLTIPLPEESQPNQSYQTAENKPVNFRKNEQQSIENSTNSVNKGFSYKAHHGKINNKIGLFGDIHEYIIEYKQKDSEEASIKRTVKADVTWFCLEGLLNHTFYSIYVSANYSTSSFRSAEFLLYTDENNSSKTNVCSCHPPGVKPGDEKCDLNSLDICHCREGYTGLFCHQCKHFFYEKDGHCLSCPCKSDSSFFCTLVGEVATCYCKKGYNGKNCEVCDNGYFSYYDKCAKCICNDNVDLNSPEICDPRTGACMHCLRNTTGFACDDCLPGFVGDPILHKNCTYEGAVWRHMASWLEQRTRRFEFQTG
ncbi:multiple epidermal growth factor-like domains 9 [Octopus vulgaris]|uniref:Multiple epidermal growth factor-like domains 9 n=1 Tax=Octopus vulgaris TaxID=6645 RepID=A0AA36AHS3_OCTVU|nr:multiple epidermal growth factor-like domains 9 [Octopus vulgaris]